MTHPARRAHRITTGLLLVLPLLIAMTPMVQGRAATAPSSADRTMPHLKFTCPAAIGDHGFTHILPDGPLQEQCFYRDKHGSQFAVGASWRTRPADPSDTRATCVEQSETVWHETRKSGKNLARYSATRRANGYIFLDLHWPDAEKLARQRALLGQMETLGDTMLAAAVKLAQPCYPATPTTGATPSGTAEPSTSPSPTPEPSTSPTDEEPLCDAVHGTLHGTDARPVEGIVVRLSVAGRKDPLEATTDAGGRFRFDDLPDTDAARAADAAELTVLIRDGGGLWRVHAGRGEARLVTRPFALTASAGCRHDLTTASLRGYATANPATVATWEDLWVAVTELRRGFDYMATTLGVTLHDVPVLVYLWCPASLSSKTCIPDGTGAYASDRPATHADRTAGLGGSGRVPHVVLAPGLTDHFSDEPLGDALYHELGHILQADLAGGFRSLLVRGRTNHAGYANASSNDSWVEGFASWFAISLRQADGRRWPHYRWYDQARLSLKHTMKAWDGNGTYEEWAVASLLTDLTDTGAPAFSGAGQPLESTTTGTGPTATIRGVATGMTSPDDVVLVTLYDAADKVVAHRMAYVSPNSPKHEFTAAAMTDFTRARARLYRVSTIRSGPDDDPFSLTPRTVVTLLTDPPDVGTRGERPSRSATVFDMRELYTVLHARLKNPGDVEALFRDHGFYENLKHPNTYVAGAPLGMTSHASGKDVLDPRYGTRILPQQYVTVDTGGVRATVIVFPEDGVPYQATPDARHRVPVLVPGSTTSRVAVVTLAEGSRPAASVIEGATFWPEAAKHEGSFLALQPELVPVAATQRSSSRPSDTLVIGGSAALALFGFGLGAAVIGRAHRRGRSRS